jgi:hypothetical protein
MVVTFTEGQHESLPFLVAVPSKAARLLGSRVRIPLKTWMFFCLLCFVLASGLWDALIIRLEDSFWVYACVKLCVMYKP